MKHKTKQNLENERNPLSVKVKLILLMIFVAFTSVLLVSLISYFAGRTIINDQINKEIKITTEGIMDAVNKTVFNRFNDMQILINDSVLRSSETTIKEKTEVLKNSLINLGWYENLYLADPQGTVIASTKSSAIGEKVSDEEWFQNTLENFFHVSDVTKLDVSSKDSLIYSNTLTDENNNFSGIVFGELSLRLFDDQLRNTIDDFEIFLLTENGEVIASKTNSNEDITEIEVQNADNETYIIETIKSEGYLSFDGNGWELLVQIPKATAFAPLDRFTYLMFISLFIIFLEVLVVGNFSARIFTKPINILKKGVESIEKGRLGEKIIIKSKDEFGYLATNFNRMSSSILRKNRSILEEKGKYKSILESTDEGIILLDKDHKVLAYNKRLAELFKISEEDLNKYSDVFKYFEKNLEVKTVLKSKDFKKNLNLEVVIQKPHFKILNIYSKPVVTNKGSLLGRIWVFNDVTKERESERSQREFIKMASHKLRTPVTAISWGLEIVEDLKNNPEELKEFLSDTHENLGRLHSLVDILLIASEIKNNQISLKSEEALLGDLLNKLSQEFKEVKFPKNKKLASLKIKTDHERISQVLSFLLKNALTFQDDNRQNQVKLEILNPEKFSNDQLKELGLNSTKNLKNKIIFKVSDKGIGISEEEKPKIFTKFFRGEKAALIDTEGTGLSLFLAKIILDSAKEKIWFQSQEGQGSTFYFTLKLQ